MGWSNTVKGSSCVIVSESSGRRIRGEVNAEGEHSKAPSCPFPDLVDASICASHAALGSVSVAPRCAFALKRLTW